MLCKMYGELKVTDNKGKSTTHVWDYAQNKPMLKDKVEQMKLDL